MIPLVSEFKNEKPVIIWFVENIDQVSMIIERRIFRCWLITRSLGIFYYNPSSRHELTVWINIEFYNGDIGRFIIKSSLPP